VRVEYLERERRAGPTVCLWHGKRGGTSSTMSWRNAGNDEVEVDFWKLQAHLNSQARPPLSSLSCGLLGRDRREQEFPAL